MQVFVGWLAIPLLGVVALVLYKQKIVFKTIKAKDKIILQVNNGLGEVKNAKISVLLTAQSKPKKISSKPTTIVDAVTGVYLEWEKKVFKKNECWKIRFENDGGFVSQPVFSCSNNKAAIDYCFENQSKK